MEEKIKKFITVLSIATLLLDGYSSISSLKVARTENNRSTYQDSQIVKLKPNRNKIEHI